MTMQLHHILTGKRSRRFHEQQQTFIDEAISFRIAHIAIKQAMALPFLALASFKDGFSDRHGAIAR